MCGPLFLEPYCGKPDDLCPAWDTWSLAVQAGRLVDVSDTAQTLGFIDPVALSASLCAELQKVPCGAPAIPFPQSLEALLRQTFRIIQVSQTPASRFSFRLVPPGRPHDFLSVEVTYGQKKEGAGFPVVLLRPGEPFWFSPPDRPCAECDYPLEVQEAGGAPLYGAINANPYHLTEEPPHA